MVKYEILRKYFILRLTLYTIFFLFIIISSNIYINYGEMAEWSKAADC
jgi:hypothetical protein